MTLRTIRPRPDRANPASRQRTNGISSAVFYPHGRTKPGARCGARCHGPRNSRRPDRRPDVAQAFKFRSSAYRLHANLRNHGVQKRAATGSTLVEPGAGSVVRVRRPRDMLGSSDFLRPPETLSDLASPPTAKAASQNASRQRLIRPVFAGFPYYAHSKFGAGGALLQSLR